MIKKIKAEADLLWKNNLLYKLCNFDAGKIMEQEP